RSPARLTVEASGAAGGAAREGRPEARGRSGPERHAGRQGLRSPGPSPAQDRRLARPPGPGARPEAPEDAPARAREEDRGEGAGGEGPGGADGHGRVLRRPGAGRPGGRGAQEAHVGGRRPHEPVGDVADRGGRARAGLSVRYAWYVAVVLMVCNTLSFIDRQILGLLVTPIKLELGLSDTRIGLLQGLAFGVFYTLLGIPMGRIADHSSRRKLVAAGIFGWSLMTALCAGARSF